MSENSTQKREVLSDWGEFRLIREIVLPAFSSRGAILGDDCAFVDVPGAAKVLAVTVDVGPEPLVRNLGHYSYRTWGWYAVAISASDLAAAGASPIAFANSVEAPSDFLVDDLRDFFDGVAAANQEFGLASGGGNIREAPRFECHGTAIGHVSSGSALTRSGCKPGDQLVAVGECGLFVSAYIRARASGIASLGAKELDRILRPRPPIRAMTELAKTHTISAATDNSDGVLGSLWNIAESSQCGVELFMDDAEIPLAVREAALTVGAEAWNLIYCWGDWQTICAIKRTEVDRFWSVVTRCGITARKLGVAVEGIPKIYGFREGRLSRVRVIRNENFTRTSFNRGGESQLEYMLHTPLFLD